MELNRLTDQQIAVRIVGYVERLEKMMSDVENYIQGKKDQYQNERIHDEYKRLKAEIRTDAHYLDLSRNDRDDASKVYEAFFSPSILEAAAFGLTEPTNSRINYKFHSAIEEAHYKLTKYFSLKQWQAIADGIPPFKG